MVKLVRYWPWKTVSSRATFICHYGLCCCIVWPTFLFDCFEKIRATCKTFLANGLPPPPPPRPPANSSSEMPAEKPLPFVHHQSAIPTKSKLNFIRNERKRIEDRCCSHISATQHLNTFDGILRVNGYPENSIEQTKRPQNPQRKPQPANTEWLYLKIPYIFERLNHGITNIFRT